MQQTASPLLSCCQPVDLSVEREREMSGSS